ncbi:MAG: hypothetical protein IT382_18575 [Deltaproteobacteria bacterium]|nr:hypothetical protein [Deltaproteobacteria bacterium]
MGLIGDIAGAFGISKTGMLAGALKFVGVPEKAAHAIGLAAELARGFTKDGFDFDKVNKGALARHAMKAFGINSPLAHLGGMAALKMLPKGFCGSALASVGTLGAGALALTALGSLGKSQLNLGTMLTGLVGLSGMGPQDIAGAVPKFLFGNKTAEMRQLTGMTRSDGGPGSMMASLPRPAMFEDIVAAFMIDVIKDKQENVEGRLKELDSKDNAGKSAGNQAKGGLFSIFSSKGNQAAQDGNSDSRNIQFEIIKNEIQKLSQMQQAMSNVLNTMHEQAMGAIRHIKA